MKRLILAIAALGLIFANTPAMAAGANPPKNLCLDFNSFGDVNQLLVKNQGTLRTANGLIKMFSIFGHAFNGSRLPVVGSGYVVPGTTTFHATFNGNSSSGATTREDNYELVFDLVTQTGTIKYHYENNAGSQISGSDGVVATDCAALPLPSVPVRDGRPFSADQ